MLRQPKKIRQPVWTKSADHCYNGAKTKALLSRSPGHHKEACDRSCCCFTKSERSVVFRRNASGCVAGQSNIKPGKGMPLPRRRSSILGQADAERPGSVSRMSTGSTSGPRGTFVGSASSNSTSCLGARVSRRALGISSIFLQGLRSTSAPVLPKHAERGHLLGAEGLNSCLLEYRDKVHTLEELNNQLEEQIHNCLDRKTFSVKTWGTLRQEWEDIYRQVGKTAVYEWNHFNYECRCGVSRSCNLL